ncbi:MAG: bifunctional UDP-N-acetylglucosamine pyrophosphorylase / glucosamine-phosphate N-acetyltransferase [Thermoleophilaceae bacterium]|jgi:bifunctional UDP-N-acetylglucosamine pyrophosphorylase/glucosamine-1-phosphate N-acetyltransferase|nr:bifunctional UDP-N-acetylglucosamine pyrophosphorylase / glucosamine-phosphate N-acetyltransferase [Thermoleophilaceae bacterium]MEA2400427.1 bifunctional UDP-N-acetylglucosamine pyrophosphorylase / glucosamine-phosphate N-acetyltransferase [Thermoleophilaceae bacterium]
MTEPFTVLIMAAGQGTRMRSDVPKVLHRICGKPMIEWVVDAAREAGAARVVCVVRPDGGVAEGLPEGVEVVEQQGGEGTGAAVLAARDAVEPGPFMVLSGDHPLVTADQISELLTHHRDAGAAATLLTTELQDPAGYGRIVRDDQGEVDRIVETKHAEEVDPEALAIREINLGTYVFEAPLLFDGLERVTNQNGERFLTGAFPVLKAEGARIVTCKTDDLDISHGVNDRAGLMEAEELAQRRILEDHARAGVTFLHPGSTRVEAGVQIGVDTEVGPGVSLLGDTSVGGGCTIGPHTTARDSRIGDGASVVHSFLVEAEVHDQANIGPFTYLRPGTVVRERAKVGAFVEVKNSDIGAGAKVPHLSYIGDADVGEGTNLGASTITANYDGRRKHRTKIGKSVKTGVHTSLVAPVDVGDRAYTGAGSTITEDVPEGALGVARPKQENIEGYSDRVEEDSQ